MEVIKESMGIGMLLVLFPAIFLRGFFDIKIPDDAVMIGFITVSSLSFLIIKFKGKK